MRSIEAPWLLHMIDVEHDETRGDGVGGLACAVSSEAASVRGDDGQLTFEASHFVGVIAVEEFDLVADVLDKGLLHSLLNA
jgi:hypothetical protein